MPAKIIFSGDTSINVVFDQQISPAISNQVLAVASRVRDAQLPGMIDIVPAYATVSLIFDPLVIDLPKLQQLLTNIVDQLDGQVPETSGHIYEIPVLYNEEVGLDLAEVAQLNQLTPQEVIDLHTATPYRIYMLGFLPGFAYLGGLDPKIHTPRRNSPRLAVPAGSVGIAGGQTGFYPVVSPGGWQVIGRIPLKMYDAAHDEQIFAAGDAIHFKAIDQKRFDELSELALADYLKQKV